MRALANRAYVLAPFVVLAGCDSGGRSAAVGTSTATTGSAAVTAPVSRASIKIDGAHDATKNGAPYSIPKSTELVLDGSGHVFASVDAAGLGQPNMVHVLHGSSEYYRATFSGKWPLTLNAASLDAVKGGAFAGFEPGEPYIVAVGAEQSSPEGTMRFAPAWMGKVIVSP